MSSAPFDIVNMIVRAGAGAGKTTELTERVISLALQFQQKQGRFPKFIVTTFTRKATQELRQRLLEKAIEKENNELLGFVQRQSQLHISTIHGVLGLFLTQFGSQIGLSPQYSFSSIEKDHHRLKVLLRKLSKSDLDFSNHFQTLLENFSFQEVFESFHRYFEASLSGGHLDFFRISDFDKEKERRIELFFQKNQELVDLISDLPLTPAWSEFLGLCREIKNGMALADAVERIPVLRKSKDLPEEAIDLSKNWKDLLNELLEWNMQEGYFDLHEKMATSFQICAEKICSEILKSKIESSEISMSDLEILASQVIRQFPDAAKGFSEKWDYWLVDEFQDTSPLQVHLLKSLIGDRKHFVVGDPQQSIYLFRGARSEVFFEKENEFKGKNGFLVNKMMNYRSEPELLEFLNDFFKGLSPQFLPMEPKDSKYESKKVVADFFQVVSEGQEDGFDLELIAAFQKTQELIKAGAKPEEIVILARNNKDIDEAARIARDFQIPVQINSSSEFRERPEVIDALCLLRFIVNPHDNANLIQLLRSPYFKISDQKLVQWIEKDFQSYWAGFLRIAPSELSGLRDILQEAQKEGIGSAWQKGLLDHRFFDYCQFQDPSGMREANLWKLIQNLRSAERLPGFSFQEFLKTLGSGSETSEEGGDLVAVPVVAPQKINIMTVHASKGLQFDHVILPKTGKNPTSEKAQFWMLQESLEMNSRRQWTLSLPDQAEGIRTASIFGEKILSEKQDRLKEEDDRVLYVALTRARRSVCLIWSEKPGKNSWIQKSQWPLKEGVSDFGKYSCLFRIESPICQKQERALSDSLQIQTRFQFQSQVKVHRSVTEIVAGGAHSDRKIQRQPSDLQKAVLGVNVHRAFENLKYYLLKDSQLGIQELIDLTQEDLREPLQFLKVNQEGPWFELIKNGHVEYGFAVKDGDFFLQGQIDLWGIDSNDQVWIVDYKTGSEIYLEKAFDQLNVYHWALKSMQKIKPGQVTQLAVIYPFTQKVIIRQPSGWSPWD